MSEDPHSEPPDKPPPKGTLSLFLQYWRYGLSATLNMIIHDALYLFCASLLGTITVLFDLYRPEFAILVALVPSLLVGLPVGGGIFITILPAIWREKTILEQYSEAPSDSGTMPDQPRVFLEWRTWWGRGAAALIHCFIPKIFLVTPIIGMSAWLAHTLLERRPPFYGIHYYYSVHYDVYYDARALLPEEQATIAFIVICLLLFFIFLPAVTGYFFLRAFPLFWDKHLIRAAFQPRPVIKKFRPDPKKMKFPKSSSGRVKAQAKAKRKKAPKHRKSAPSSNAKAKSDDAG